MKEISEKLRNTILSAIPTSNLVLCYVPLYGTNPTIKCRVSSDNNGTFTNPKWKTLPNGLVVPSYAGTGYIKNSTADWRSGDSQGAIGILFKTTYTASQYLFASCDEASTVRIVALGVSGTTGYMFSQQRNNDTSDGVQGGTATNDGKWHLAFLTSNGTAYSIILDGKAETLSIWSGANTGDWFADTANRDNFSVGAYIMFAPSGYVRGQIGLVVVYSEAPTTAEILRMSNRLKGVFH